MRKQPFSALLVGLILINLACTLGSVASSTPAATSPALAPAQPVGTPLAATVQSTAAAFPTISGQPTLAPTTGVNLTAVPPTDSAANSSAPPTTKSIVPTAAQTKISVTASPLAFTYEVIKITRNPNNQALLTLHVLATGGAGGYKYYHDNVLEPGHTFDVLGTCGAKFTHTLKVQSVDGQTATQQYQVSGICPTPTATPK